MHINSPLTRSRSGSRRRTRLATATIVALGVALAGCGDGDGDVGSIGDPPSRAVESTTTTAPSTTTESTTTTVAPTTTTSTTATTTTTVSPVGDLPEPSSVGWGRQCEAQPDAWPWPDGWYFGDIVLVLTDGPDSKVGEDLEVRLRCIDITPTPTTGEPGVMTLAAPTGTTWEVSDRSYIIPVGNERLWNMPTWCPGPFTGDFPDRERLGLGSADCTFGELGNFFEQDRWWFKVRNGQLELLASQDRLLPPEARERTWMSAACGSSPDVSPIPDDDEWAYWCAG